MEKFIVVRVKEEAQIVLDTNYSLEIFEGKLIRSNTNIWVISSDIVEDVIDTLLIARVRLKVIFDPNHVYLRDELVS